MKTPALQVDGIRSGYGHKDVLHGISFELSVGEVLGVAGPNGSGKSTLLRALTGLIPLRAGRVQIEGRDLGSLGARERARLCAVQPQIEIPPFDYSARDFVLLGRHPHRALLGAADANDWRATDRAMELVGIGGLAGRGIRSLSTGEWQRALLARALAQETPLIFLDEPAAHLDPGHRHAIHTLLRRLAHEDGRAILCVSHDLDLAAEFCDRLMLLQTGSILALGTPGDVMREEILQNLFHCAALRVVTNPYTGRPGAVFAP